MISPGPPAVPLAQDRAERVPAQGVAAALIVQQMSPAPGPGRPACSVPAKADRTGPGDHAASGLAHQAPPGDARPVHGPAEMLPDPGIADPRRPGAQPGAGPQGGQGRSQLLQQPVEALRADAVEIKWAEGLPQEHPPLPVPALQGRFRPATVNSCKKLHYSSVFP